MGVFILLDGMAYMNVQSLGCNWMRTCVILTKESILLSF